MNVIADIQDLMTRTLVPGEGKDGDQIADVHFPAQNAFLVLTDNATWAADGVGVPNVTSYGAGLQEVAREYRDGNVEIITGNTYHLMNALEVMEGAKQVDKPLLMIETLLDADDGLNNQGIEWIQDIAVEQSNKLRAESKSIIEYPTLNSTWFVLCGTDHIEWHNRDIFRFTNREYETLGLTSGITGMRHAPLYCASAGYTRVGFTAPADVTGDKNSQRGVSSDTGSSSSNNNNNGMLLFPQQAYSNHALAVSFPACNVTQKIQCLRRELPGKAFILKSRSITSDSMDHMNPKHKDYRDNNWENKTEHVLFVNETEHTWRILQEEFSIKRLEAWNVSVYLRDNAEEIVKENQQSRCAPGFPCREVTKKTFKKLSMHLRMMDRKNEREQKGLPLPKLRGGTG
ncbi:MAG: hypothetical protein SGILL_001419 [Bacillariaceae sp.]